MLEVNFDRINIEYVFSYEKGCTITFMYKYDENKIFDLADKKKE